MNVRHAWLGMTLCLTACSADPAGEPGRGDDVEQDEDPSTGQDGSVSHDGADSAAGDGFDECAEVRFDAATGRRAANIVWVIDTSGSMLAEAAQVQTNMNDFVTSIGAAGLEDYRVVVVSKPSYVTVPDPLGSDDARFRFVEESVKSNEPLEDLVKRFEDYGDFLLPEVVTHFVVVTDDDSDLDAERFISEMSAALGETFRVHAIASPPGAPPAPGDGDDEDDDDRGCEGPNGDAAAPGVEHFRAAELTMGLTFSICTEDWSGLFGTLAEAVSSSAPLPCELALPEAPAGESLDPARVNVLHTGPEGDGTAWPRVDSANACGDRAAWYYDDPSAPAQIRLCPTACERAGEGGQLEIALGCASVVL